MVKIELMFESWTDIVKKSPWEGLFCLKYTKVLEKKTPFE